ncbi:MULTISPECIES: CusA/CzcA family heavy metal efflux RND transporter [unclassified Dyella]|uniref:efflux RND transporter permease subunit n=1 Tax=unclassified Dyella TaxID=2634549 RepID=UPI000C81E9C4|nr:MULTISPECIES: CusA/CzcA family heavy metal efflux RND transporter [unclassified Dyella]MDR3447138.1 CusA/CzcA family heavy metal efflux RND transporter [Dyella sp.]PMQ04804.1 Cobalt-zinc-cadmium resistance protein CzcA [Dyella sp. AD56]
MINAIFHFCFQKRVLFIVVSALVLCFGYYSWTQLAIEAYPELSDVTAQVTTQVPGLAAEEIEQQITIPLERGLSGTPGLVSMRSSSTFGLSLITLVFKDGAEDYWSRQRVMERISQVTLPPGITPGLDPVSGPAGEIYRYTLESTSKNLMELSELQRWVVVPALERVSGVANVDIFGGFTKEFRLELDPNKLLKYGVSISQVSSAISANTANAGGGRITRGEQSYIVRGIGMVHTLKDLGDVVVTQSNGVPVLVRDLGKLEYGHQVREGILGKDNNPDTIEGIVDLLKYENPSRVLEGIHSTVAELNKQLAAQDVRIVPYIDRDDLVEATKEKVFHTVMEGVGLVCIVLILFLGSPRSAMVAAVAIPMSLVTVFILMQFTHMPANLFSLGAIDFGVIVDGTIVVTEAILRRREEKPEAVLTEDDVMTVTKHVGRSIFFATLIIVTAYLPLFAFEHAEGKLFRPMAFTVGYALLAALLCTVTLTPGLAYIALRKPRKIFHNKPLERLQRAYTNSLGRLLGKLPIVYSVAGVAFAGVLILGMTIGREFLPELDEGSLWLQVQMPTGLSLDKASAMTADLRRAVREFPEVSFIVTQLGRNDTGTDPWTPSHVESGVGLKPYDKWPDHESKAEFLRRFNARMQQIPGISVGISQPIVDGENDMIGGAHSPLVLRIYGDDLSELRRIGGEIVDVLHGVRGTADASIFQEPPIPQLAITADRDAAARYGINVGDISNLIQTAIGGSPITQVYVGDRTYNVTARLSNETANSLEAIGQLPLTSASGAQVPLKQVADIRYKTGESTIAHEQTKRQITIRVDNRDRALSEYLADAQAQIDAKVHFDKQAYQLQWAGTFENQQRAQARLVVVMSLVLAIMLVFLFFEFGKLHQAVMVLAVVPLATVGGLISLHVRGETLNIATAVGFIALFGVAVQNGIIMVANINRVRKEGLHLRDAVLEGATERFRPVLMTATVASVGMLPAALATGIGTDVQRGLATVVVGGLPIATLLTLFILPGFYFAIERFIERRRRQHRPHPSKVL